MQSLGRAAEVELLGDGDEVAQLAQFHCPHDTARCEAPSISLNAKVVAAGRGGGTIAA